MNELITLESLNALTETEITKAVVESDDFSAQYAALKDLMSKLDGVKKKLDGKIKEVAQDVFQKEGITTIRSNKYNFTYCAPSTSLSVDSAKLKKEYPDVYTACAKVTNRESSLRVTERKPDEEQ